MHVWGLRRSAPALVAAAALSALSTVGVPPPSAHAATTLPPIKHVFVLVLENKNFDETFAPGSAAPYLAQTLVSNGQFLRNYYGIGHLSLDNYVAMISGQAPNPQTQSDCEIYSDFIGLPALDPNGQAVGDGCVYPAIVKTLPDQLTAKGLTWKGYMEDMGNSATEPKTCRHPALNSQDGTQTAKVGDQYAARHNPFVYFHTIIDSPACAANDVPLDRLRADLASVATTANYSFITPNLCNDGHDGPCKDGAPGGLTGINTFLTTWVPKIIDSPAYQQDGMLLITFDEAEANPQSPSTSDASACCGEGPGPNSALPGIFGLGGGRVGAVVLSPWTTPGSVNDTTYNHYSMLRTFEDLFGLDHLGYAAGNVTGASPGAFGADVFNAPGRVGLLGGKGPADASPGVGGSTGGRGSTTLAATGADSRPWAALAAVLLALALLTRRHLVRARR